MNKAAIATSNGLTIPTTTSPERQSSSGSRRSSSFRKFLCILSPNSSSKQQQYDVDESDDDGGAAAASSMSSSKRAPAAPLNQSHRPQLALVAGSHSSSDLERVFSCFDENGDGKISPAELRNCMRAAGEELSQEEAEAVVESTDSDGDGQLGLDDFAKLVTAREEEEKGRDLKEAFRMYAASDHQKQDDCITPKSLRRMLKRLGESKTSKECAAMICRFDLNGDGVLTFDEFQAMMHGRLES